MSQIKYYQLRFYFPERIVFHKKMFIQKCTLIFLIQVYIEYLYFLVMIGD